MNEFENNENTINEELNETEVENQVISIIKEKETEVKSWKQKYMYLAADFDTYKRNATKEKENIYITSQEKVIKELIYIMDDFERAFKHTSEENIVTGFMLIYKKFANILSKFEVSVISPEVGEDFDESYHEAVLTQPTNNKELENKISTCIETGYMLKNKVIRYAKVGTYVLN